MTLQQRFSWAPWYGYYTDPNGIILLRTDTCTVWPATDAQEHAHRVPYWILPPGLLGRRGALVGVCHLIGSTDTFVVLILVRTPTPGQPQSGAAGQIMTPVPGGGDIIILYH